MTPEVAWEALVAQLPTEYRVGLDDFRQVYTKEEKCIQEIREIEKDSREWVIIQTQGLLNETNPLTGKSHSATSAERNAKDSQNYKKFKDRIHFLRGEEGACRIERQYKHLILQFLAQ